MKIEEIKINSQKYPQKLKNIYDPPTNLFILGNKEILNKKSIAIVGSREATNYGKKVAYKFSKELAENGINIISGLAIGIDMCAHIGALKAENIVQMDKKVGKTIAVMGSGFNNIYPKENIELAREIVRSGGCIITEYPLNMKPLKVNFPQRNRIISGLADGVLVVEAGKKSGALITAEFAIDNGIDVFAIPGDINKEQSVGCNELIKDGAIMVTSSKEVLELI